MTDPRDPIEAWLGADVELLPPRPGEFEHVRRRARRRKTMSAMTAVAGAAAVIAAAVVVPQVTGVLQGNGGPTSFHNTPATRTHHTKPAGSPTPRASVRPVPGPALPTTGPGALAAATRFQPTSVTFIGTSVGAVIGQARCKSAACTAVAGTADYGGAWSKMGAPAAGAPDGSSGVSQIRFNITARYGWAFGPALYATRNGGKSWYRERLPGRVLDLATVSGHALAVVAQCTGGGATYWSGCTSFALYRTADGSKRWTPVPGASGTGAEAPGGLQLAQSGVAYLLAGGHLFTGAVTGGAWHQAGSGSGTPPCLRGPRQNAASLLGPALLAPVSGTQVYLACDAAGSAGSAGRLTLYVSADSGRTWQVSGPITARGTATSLAAITGGAILLATTDGLYYSTGGVSWSRAAVSGRAPHGFAFVGMTTTTQGVAVPADQALGEVFISTDGGYTWRASKIN